MLAGFLGLAAAIFIFSHPLDAAGSYVLPCVILLAAPGWASAVALFPRPGMPPGERLLYAAGLALAWTTFLGLILNGLPSGLDRESWSIGMGALAATTSVAAWIRTDTSFQVAIPGVPAVRGAACALAACLAGGGLALSQHGASANDTRNHYTQVWAHPRREGGRVVAVAYGVENREGRRKTYILIARTADKSILFRDGPFTLPTGMRHTASRVVSPASDPYFTLDVLSAGDATTNYGHLKIWTVG